MSEKSSRRFDTAVLIALIGLCGTMCAALISNPLLLDYIRRTPTPLPATATPETATPTDFPLPTATLEPGPTETPSPTVTPNIVMTDTPTVTPLPTPQAQLVFSEDFDDSVASGFGFSDGQWGLAKGHGNPALEGQPQTDQVPAKAVFGPSDFANGSVEFQVSFKNPGTLALNFRDDNTQTYVLSLSPPDQKLSLGYASAANNWTLEPFSGLSTHPFTFIPDTWYTVRLEAAGSNFTVWVDGNRLMSLSDDRLAQGFLEFDIYAPGIVDLDNIKVWDLGQ